MLFQSTRRHRRFDDSPHRSRSSRQNGRIFEVLEDRRVLATIPVSLVSDAANPVDDGEITLREAIQYVNGVTVPDDDKTAFDFGNLGTNDKIIFNLPAGEDTITLGRDDLGNAIAQLQGPAGELNITEAVTIDAEEQDITIDASGTDPTPLQNNGDGSRVFDIRLKPEAGESWNVELRGLTLSWRF